MRLAGLVVPFVWVDVEPYPTHPWSRDRLANRQVVRGVVRAYEDAGYRVGFYSYDGGWRAVVGTLQRGLNMRPTHVTGRFDDRTRRVVLAFQQGDPFEG